MKTDCCCPPAHVQSCGCCEGVERLTPLQTINRPGLPALSYRIGTHATFLETMKARLTTLYLEKEVEGNKERVYPLQKLTSREADDPSIALLDAWATVADVLTFYQERLVNEGYLRTATERRSILDLARLVGYRLRPGVASSVYLAYTLDDNFKEETIIAKGARSQSVPGPGELPQSFETSEDLKTRAKWNNLKPRMTQPQTSGSIEAGNGMNQRIYLKGIATNLNPNDPLLIDFGSGTPEFHRVKEVKPDAQADRTVIILQKKAVTPDSNRSDHSDNNPISGSDLIGALTLPPSPQVANSLKLDRSLEAVFRGNKVVTGKNSIHKALAGGEASHATLKAFAPVLRETLATAMENAQVTKENPIKAYALRTKASLFGQNHPGTPIYTRDTETGMITVQGFTLPSLNTLWPGMTDLQGLEKIAIEPHDEQVKASDWAVIERPVLNFNSVVTGRTYSVHEVRAAEVVSMSALGFSSKVSLLTVDEPWLAELTDAEVRTLLASTPLLRQTVVYTRSDELALAEEPINETVCGGTDELLELDGLYEGLESGRWVIVSGERDIPGTSGVRFSELAMLASVTQTVGAQLKGANVNSVPAPDFSILDGDRTRTFIQLAQKLEYCFKRDTVRIYGNVVKATHGETRKEVVGSGDGAKALQSFVLKQPPLTFVSAPNPSGVDSTLTVYVNEVQWKEIDALAGLAPTDRMFVTKTDDEDKTTVIFGNGREGARLPTGIENIKAEYRNGIGKPGNVKAGQITLLSTRPLGVKEVINPLRASGGADKEGRDQARKNAPLAVKALDRLVSVQDYEDFTRVYAGIGKAHAVETSDGRRQVVHITIAGADDIPIDENSDLYRNLRQSLLDFGDPYQPIQVAIRELMLIVISAKIRILPEYRWEPVVTQVRSSLLESFSFDRRELGQDVLLSEVISVMQAVRGVAYVDVDVFGGVPEKKVKATGGEGKQRLLLTPQEVANEVASMIQAFSGNAAGERLPQPRLKVNLAEFEKDTGKIRPAQIAFLTPDVPDTLILNQIT